MKQKIVVKVTTLNDEKSRCKALESAVGVSGVESAEIVGNDKSQIEIVGDGVDPIKLVLLLRKKVGDAEIVSIAVGAVGEKKEEKKGPQVAWPYYYGGPSNDHSSGSLLS